MELANAERALAPGTRRATMLAARLAREELGGRHAEDFDRLVLRMNNQRNQEPWPSKRKRKRGRRHLAPPGGLAGEGLFMGAEERERAQAAQRRCTAVIYEDLAALQANKREVDLSDHVGSLSDQTLWELGEMFAGSESLRIRGWKRVSIAGLRSIALGFGDRLASLDLSDCPLTDEMAAMLAARFFNLRSLVLRSCPLLTNSAIRSVAEATNQSLTLLDVSSCTQLTEESLMWLAGQNGPAAVPCSRLVSLSLEGCAGIRDRGLVGLGRGCRRLTFVNLAGCSAVTDRGVKGLVALGARLQIINLAGCLLLTDASLAALGSSCAESLRSLNLSRCVRVTDAGLEALVACRRLQSVNLAGCAEVSELGIFFLVKHNKAMQTLNVNGCELISRRGLQEMLRGLPFVELAESYAGFKPKGRAARLKMEAQAQIVQNTAAERITAALRGHGERLLLARDREAARRRAAAERLQCWYRQILARTMYVGVLLRRAKSEAASRLQTWWRQRLGRLLCLLRRAQHKQNRVLSVYAVKIQAAFRGKVAREVNPEVNEAISMLKEARWAESLCAVVVRAQAIARGRISKVLHAAKREELSQRSRDMVFAAVRVQAIVRALVCKKRVARRRQWYKRHFAKQLRAATSIQKVARCWIGKRKFRTAWLEREAEQLRAANAATAVQRMRRGQLGRAAYKAKLELRARQNAAANGLQRVFRGSRVPRWQQLRLQHAKACIRERAQALHERAVRTVQERVELREMGFGHDSASEDEHIRELGGFVEDDEEDDWQEHWDETLQRVFFFSPSRNVRTFEPYGEGSFDEALIDKYVKVHDPSTGQWRQGVITKLNRNKRKHRIEYSEPGLGERDQHHEWVYVRENESRLQVYDEEAGTWGMMRSLRVAYQQLQKALKAEIDELNASLSAGQPASESSSWFSTDETSPEVYSVLQSHSAGEQNQPVHVPMEASWDDGSLGIASSQLESDGTVERHWDQTSGLYYYYNAVTGESTWENPEQ